MKAQIRLEIVKTYPNCTKEEWEGVYDWILKADMEEAEQKRIEAEKQSLESQLNDRQKIIEAYKNRS